MTQKKLNLITKQNKKEIFYNLVNSAIAGGLVFLGALLNGGFDWKAVFLGAVAGAITALIKFKDYWDGESPEYCKCLLKFI